MNILQNTTIISVLSISTAHGTTVSDLFRYPIETVNSKYGRKEKRGVKFEKKNQKWLHKQTIPRVEHREFTKQCPSVSARREGEQRVCFFFW